MENVSEIDKSLVGKSVIVRANVAGVHAGIVEAADTARCVIKLKNARRLWRVYTRDKSGSISDVAKNGLKSGEDHSIGVPLPTVTIPNPAGLEIAEMTPEAWESVLNYQSK